MDPEDFKSMLRSSGVDLWTLIDAAVFVAARDHGDQLKARRDGIVERIYCNGSVVSRNCDRSDDLRVGGAVIEARSNGRADEEMKGSSSPLGTPQSMNGDQSLEEEGDDRVEEEEEVVEEEGDRRINDEKSQIFAIKDFLDDEDQSEDSLVSLLQNLADMDITFQALKETDIGRNVNGLRKHPSPEVRRLVKQLIRKWKETVDKWVKSSSPGDNAGESNHPVPDFGYSPNPHSGSYEPIESQPKGIVRRESQPKPNLATTAPSSTLSAKGKEQKDGLLDPERLASARRRLHENYQEAQNAKKQRTIQVMDIHEIPRSKNSFIARNNKGAPHHR